MKAEEQEQVVKRSPWLAFFMSLFIAGWGQIYCGQAKRGVSWFFATALLAYSVVLLPWLWFPFGVKGALGLFFGAQAVRLLAAIDASNLAKKDCPSRNYQSGKVYLGVLLLVFGFSQSVKWAGSLAGGALPMPSRPFTIPSGSMIPTLSPGDLVIADMWVWGEGEPSQGELAVFSYETEPERTFVGRIVAVPGDEILVAEGVAKINGSPVSYSQEAPFDDFPPKVVPPDHYFILGDNINNSRDSRYMGSVPKNLLRGKILGVVWPPQRLKDF